MIIWANVVVIAPDLSTIPVPTQDFILASAASVMSADTWGVKYDIGKTYLAAHLGTLYELGALVIAGQVKSETVGKVTREYEVAGAMTGDGLAATWYGEFYLYLIRTLVKARIFLVV